jgi:hypothetical protein
MEDYNEEIKILKERIVILEEKNRIKIEEDRIKQLEEDKRIEDKRIEDERLRKIEEERIKIEQEEEYKKQEEERIIRQKEIEENNRLEIMRLEKNNILKIIKDNYDEEFHYLIFDYVNKMISDNYNIIHKDLVNKLSEIAPKPTTQCYKCQNDLQKSWNAYSEQQTRSNKPIDYSYTFTYKKWECLECIGYKFNQNEMFKKLLNHKIIDMKYEVVINKKSIFCQNFLGTRSWKVGTIDYYDIFGNIYRNKVEVTREITEYNNQHLSPYNNIYFDENLFNKPFTNKNISDKNINFFDNIKKYGTKEEQELLEKLILKKIKLGREKEYNEGFKALETEIIKTKYGKIIFEIMTSLKEENYELIREDLLDRLSKTEIDLTIFTPKSNRKLKSFENILNRNELLEKLIKYKIINYKINQIKSYNYSEKTISITYFDIYGNYYNKVFQPFLHIHYDDLLQDPFGDLKLKSLFFSEPFENKFENKFKNYWNDYVEIIANEKLVGKENANKILKIIEEENQEKEKIVEMKQKLLVTQFSDIIGLSYNDSLIILSKILNENYKKLSFEYIRTNKDLLKYFQIQNKFSNDKGIKIDQTEIFFKSILRNILIEDKIKSDPYADKERKNPQKEKEIIKWAEEFIDRSL